MTKLFGSKSISTKKIIDLASELKLLEDCLSFKPFENWSQSLKVFGCYTLAAAVLPPLLAAIMTPLSYLMVAVGAFALVSSLSSSSSNDSNLGLTLMVLSASLMILNQLLPFALAATLIYRGLPLLAEKFPALETLSSLVVPA